MQLDKWQSDVLATQGNICLRSGRQVGKSTVIAIKAGEYAINNEKSSIMVISATERQAYLLFSKILGYLMDNYSKKIKKGKDRPTKSEIKLFNGSVIRCLPTGLDGIGIRGYTVNLLIADEAHFINEDVWQAVTPMLVTTQGIIWLLSTTHGKEGYFYKCFQDENFTKFHVTTEEVALGREEPQRSSMLKHIREEKEKMTNAQFMQEYCGEFIDELRQLFSDEIIKGCQILDRKEGHGTSGRDFYLGVDVARMGEDESTFEIFERISRDRLVHIDNIVTTKQLTTATTDMIIELNKKYNFKKIYIDDAGVGAGVFDMLLREETTKRKTVAINNSARPLDKDDKKRKRILKDDLYMNLLSMMEKRTISLLKDPEIFLSLKSIQYEYTEVGLKIWGKYSHIAEGLIRAAWAIRDKSLNIWVASKSHGEN